MSGLSPVEYEQLTSAIREVVHRVVPLNATVLVVSRGDEELLRLGSRQTMHFPQEDDGRYAGYHPADSDAAIAMVEQMRQRGGEYLVFPATAFWWLEHYEALKTYLEHRYQIIESNENCLIVQLSEGTSVDADTTFMAEAPLPTDVAASPVRELINALLPAQARIAFLAAELNGATLDGNEIWRMPSDPQPGSGKLTESLQALERSGIQFIVIPASAFSWLAEHPEVPDRLRSRHRFVTRQEHLCEIYELRAPAPKPSLPKSEDVAAQDGVVKDALADDGEDAPSDAGEGRRSFGETLRGVLFPSRRNGRRP